MILLLFPIAYAATDITPASLSVNNNMTYRNQFFIVYDSTEMTSTDDNEGVIFYTDLQCDSIPEWNTKYPFRAIKNITMKFITTPVISYANGSYANATAYMNTTEIVISDLETPIYSYKNFFTLYNRESMVALIDTAYNSTFTRDSPCVMQLFLGTKKCDRCQEVEYYEFQQDVDEAGVIKSNNELIKDNIKVLLIYNFEFFVIIYYLIMISLVMFSFGILIYILFYFYHIIKRHIK